MVGMDPSQHTHSTEVHLGCFQFGLIVNRRAVDIYVQVFVWK